jgi:hypothetical protein
VLTARKVIVSSGVLGTLELLFRNRDVYGSLPGLSPSLGQVVRTNSEAITAVLHPPGEDLTDGTAISSDFHPDANTHITQNRFDRGYRFMRYLMGPMVDDPLPWRRALKTLLKILGSPALMLSNLTMTTTSACTIAGDGGVFFATGWFPAAAPAMNYPATCQSPIARPVSMPGCRGVNP